MEIEEAYSVAEDIKYQLVESGHAFAQRVVIEPAFYQEKITFVVETEFTIQAGEVVYHQPTHTFYDMGSWQELRNTLRKVGLFAEYKPVYPEVRSEYE